VARGPAAAALLVSALGKGFIGLNLKVMLTRRLAWAAILLASAGFVSGCGHTRKAVPLVKVPDVVHHGWSLDYAYGRLRAAGLTVSVATFPPHYNQRDFFGITSQSPPPGSEVAQGSAVEIGGPYVTIGGGPGGFAGRRPANGMTTVPRVTDLPVYEALDRLERAGVYSEVTRIPALRRSDSRRLLDAYRVRRQSPPAGTRVSWGGILFMTSSGGAVDIRESQVTLVPALR
jgi:PASTA domain